MPTFALEACIAPTVWTAPRGAGRDPLDRDDHDRGRGEDRGCDRDYGRGHDRGHGGDRPHYRGTMGVIHPVAGRSDPSQRPD